MKKIAFLTASYPDFRKSATILCTHRVMEAFANDSDMEIHCLCLQYKGEKSEELINGIYVHRVPQTIFERLKYDASSKSSKFNKFVYWTLDRIQKTSMIPLYPCNSPFQLELWKKYAKQLHKLYIFDCVITEHYGYNTLQTGLFLKRLYPQLKYVPLLWDPIVGQEITAKLPKCLSHSRINNVENKVGELADIIISTVAMQKYYLQYGDRYSTKRCFLDIPSILQPTAEVQTDYLNLIKLDKINIVFSGYIDSHRDPIPILNLLNNCINAEHMNILFFCRGVDDGTKSFWKKSFKGDIIFHEYIPLPQLHTIYRHADFLLNISSLNPNLIPSKIFEYMSFGKSIISVYVTDGDSAQKYLDKYPESCVIDLKKDIAESVKKIEMFLSKKHSIVDFKIVQDLFPNNTPLKYINVIKELLND